jgi:glutamyl-Q tRNA(Asp) synthetase
VTAAGAIAIPLVFPHYRGRFAPSPTGPLHFGSLIAAVASYCDARHANGQWLVRIEDVDLPRTRAGAEHAIMRTLEHYGFVWDGPVVRQSERTALYESALARLVAAGVAFECACTRREQESVPAGPAGERVYPGTCRHGIPADRARRRQRAWRVRVDNGGDSTIVEYRDRLAGRVVQDLARDVGDFVVKRADGYFAYQLAVVVDDAQADITHVVRGADLAASTPRQIFLQRRLGLATPSYLHIPVAVDASGTKLSKETRAAALPEDPLPALAAAWRFLDQPMPSGSAAPASIAEFWAYALAAWTPSRLPPVPMLPAPAVFRPRSAGPV